MGPSSDRKRIAERNMMLSPDSGIVELTLQHTSKLNHHTTVQLRAIYANSFSSAPHSPSYLRIDGLVWPTWLHAVVMSCCLMHASCSHSSQ